MLRNDPESCWRTPFTVLVSGSDVETPDDYLREGSLVLVCVAAIGIASAVVPSHANQSFYSAAAQIIPVLLLALAFQLRAFRVRWPLKQGSFDLAEFMRTVVLSVTLLFLVVGELEALNVMAKPHPEHHNAKAVFIAVALGVVLVCFFALVSPLQEEDRST